jgi:hypothetical protein
MAVVEDPPPPLLTFIRDHHEMIDSRIRSKPSSPWCTWTSWKAHGEFDDSGPRAAESDRLGSRPRPRGDVDASGNRRMARASRPATRWSGGVGSSLGEPNVLSSRPLRPLSRVERHRLPFAKIVESRVGAGGLMKEVFVPIWRCHKSKSFVADDPFNGSLHRGHRVTCALCVESRSSAHLPCQSIRASWPATH